VTLKRGEFMSFYAAFALSMAFVALSNHCAISGEIHKWVDRDGTIHYSNILPGTPREPRPLKTKIKETKPAPAKETENRTEQNPSSAAQLEQINQLQAAIERLQGAARVQPAPKSAQHARDAGPDSGEDSEDANADEDGEYEEE
jgi:hypothetical protein